MRAAPGNLPHLSFVLANAAPSGPFAGWESLLTFLRSSPVPKDR